jgi:hypothetical protein
MARKRMPATVIAVTLMISLAILVSWIDERDREANGALIVASDRTDALSGVPQNKMREKEQQLGDCDEWAGMRLMEKRKNYRADPERWASCLCKGAGCEFDRLYITGRVSR